MNGLFGAILDVLFPIRTKQGPGSAHAVRPIYIDDINWDDRTREEKRVTAPYALGWEEGHAAAYREYVVRGRVSALTPNEVKFSQET